MLPATGTEAKTESPPPRPGRRTGGGKKRKCDTDRIAAITGHNDDSMGKFSYSG